MADSILPDPEWEIKTSETWFPVPDGTKLFLRQWKPVRALNGVDGEPRAVLHIVHGMAEHGARYDRLARRLCAAGIAVWAADLRGHGKTADPGVNDPGKGGLLGHCRDKDGIRTIKEDIRQINLKIKETNPGIPLFLLGHSWGSFLGQYYIEEYSADISGCILSGSRGPDGIKIAAAAPVLAVIAGIAGVRRRSRLSRALSDGPFNKPFKPNRTPFDWISRDEKEVDAYVADPASGMLCTAGFYYGLGFLLGDIHKPERMAAIRKDLPVYIFAGSADPVGDMGASPTALVEAYRSLAIKDLEFVLYPGARHETLNETNREEVMGDLLSWLNKHIT
jgi:alpha-beta hydrolase superfamily lysophospholipase